ncbi:MAG: U32 family peptidase [Clostridia bacterium]|nr:U32 family peptidase [Clostridia bacterium]
MSVEILAPAGSPEAVIAAVQNGANAVYLGGASFNARRRAKNFSDEELQQAVDYCHLYGVKVYATFNILVGDREMRDADEAVRTLARLGVDALIVQDVGVARRIRAVAPDMELHASTQMSVHSVEGAVAARDMGFSRVVAARELSREDLVILCRESPIEIEVFTHGALCAAYSGQCYMSALIGQRSGNRGFCAQPCRMEYRYENGKPAALMSLRELCMAPHLTELADMGVASLKIEGRMRRPEYVGLAVSVYSRALNERRAPTKEELNKLSTMFSREGFTDGYYTGRAVSKTVKDTRAMFGMRTEADEGAMKKLCDEVRRTYEGRSLRRVPVEASFTARAGLPLSMTLTDRDGHTVTASGEIPEPARSRASTAEGLAENVRKFGSTAFEAKSVQIALDDGLAIPASAVNALRRDCAEALTAARMAHHTPRLGDFPRSLPCRGSDEPPAFTVSVENISQLSDELLAMSPAIVYVPLWRTEPSALADLISRNVPVCVTLPRVILPTQEVEVRRWLRAARDAGVREALCGNIGHIRLAREEGFGVRGDFGLNAYNRQTMEYLRDEGLLSATASFELKYASIRELSGIMPTEAIVYGHLPLMLFENCLIRASSGRCDCSRVRRFTDRTRREFLLMPAFGCRTALFNAVPLWLADRRDDYESIGLTYARLSFTSESPAECVRILKAYRLGDEASGQFTRGLYVRGVE